jgi:hypothetical protein
LLDIDSTSRNTVKDKRCGKDRRSEEVETLHENDQEFVQKRTQGFCWGAQNRQREHISLRKHSIRPRNPGVPGEGVIPEKEAERNHRCCNKSNEFEWCRDIVLGVRRGNRELRSDIRPLIFKRHEGMVGKTWRCFAVSKRGLHRPHYPYWRSR